MKGWPDLILPAVNGYKVFAVTQPFHLLLRQLRDMTVKSDFNGLKDVFCPRNSAKLLNCKSSELALSVRDFSLQNQLYV